MTTLTKPVPLWETAHPYYMQEGCYYASGLDQPHGEYGSWQEFLDEWENADDDYNMVFRWDWKSPDEDNYPETEEIHIFFIMQRKAYPFSTVTKVTREDEPAIREYLQAKAGYMTQIWAPFLAVL